jgi:hypothetical protein
MSSRPRESLCPHHVTRSSSSTASGPLRQGRRQGHLCPDPRRRPGRRLHPRAAAPPPRAAQGAGRRRRHRGDHPDRRPGPDDRPHGALLAGLPKTVPGYAIDRMCAGAMTAVTTAAASRSPSARTTSPSPAASSTWAATRWARASTPTRGSSRRSSSTRPPSTWARPRRTCTTASRSSPRSAATAYAVASQNKTAEGLRRRQDPARPRARGHPPRRAAAGAWPPRTNRRARARRWRTCRAQDAVPPARQRHRRQRRGPQRRRHRLLLASEEAAGELGMPAEDAAGLVRVRRRRARGDGLSARCRRPRRRWPRPA